MREGEPGDQAFLVADGELEVLIGDEPIATLGRGELVGEIALLRERRAHGDGRRDDRQPPLRARPARRSWRRWAVRTRFRASSTRGWAEVGRIHA